VGHWAWGMVGVTMQNNLKCHMKFVALLIARVKQPKRGIGNGCGIHRKPTFFSRRRAARKSSHAPNTHTHTATRNPTTPTPKKGAELKTKRNAAAASKMCKNKKRMREITNSSEIFKSHGFMHFYVAFSFPRALHVGCH